MSALSSAKAPERSRRPSLVAVPSASSSRRISRLPFLGVLASVLGLGMVGLLLLNTTLQSQAFELNDLNAQVRDLSYTEAGLQASLDEQDSTGTLTRRASDIGMRPRDHTVFVTLPSGDISGEVQPSGEEYPEAFLDRDPAAVLAERRDDAAAVAERRIAAETESRADRRATVEQQQARAAADQAERDRRAGQDSEGENEGEAG